MLALLYVSVHAWLHMMLQCTSVLRRKNALVIFFKLHVDKPVVGRDPERQRALAAYTGQNTKQVSTCLA